MQAHREKLDRVIQADPDIGKAVPTLLELMKNVHAHLDKKPARVLVRDPVKRWPTFLRISGPLFVSSPRIQELMLEFLPGRPLSTHTLQVAPPRFVWQRAQASSR